MKDKSRGAAPDPKAAPSTEARRGRHARPDSGEDRQVSPFAAELEALRKDLDERTRDLQRLTAEYANYRRRVDRDRALVAEQATGAVLSELLGVLDDVDRARAHGDLVGPFGAVAEQLISVLSKFGLTAFGEAGDEFDPSRHEAVAHSLSSEVTEPTCVEVFRRGYTLGERLLRPALVAVADPAGDEAEEAEAPKPAEAKAAATVDASSAEPKSDAAKSDAAKSDVPKSEAAKSGAVKASEATSEGAAAGEAKSGAAEGDVEAVQADAIEAEVVEGEIVDPEAAAVAESESDAAEAEEHSDEADASDEAGQPAGSSDAETGEVEDTDAEVVDAEVVEGEVVEGEVVEDRSEAEAEDRTAEKAGAGDGAKGTDGEQPDGDQGRT